METNGAQEASIFLWATRRLADPKKQIPGFARDRAPYVSNRRRSEGPIGLARVQHEIAADENFAILRVRSPKNLWEASL
jgi:hypothetical protein